MSSSAERVFRIYELTELILLELDCPVEITRAQSVGRYWRNVIQTSSALAKAWAVEKHASHTAPLRLVYTIESTKEYLLMGDVMVIIEQIGRWREGRETLTYSLDRRNLMSLRVDESNFQPQDFDSMSQIIPDDDVAIKVLVNDAQGRLGPAFSLQRYYLDTNLGKIAKGFAHKIFLKKENI
ncbi:uncharacterized protein TRUGW13939_08914 [Talaromyces rugulosus]|uniref:F-box domain-containing protein n=1 Tax=Talaromyces rugulosus TaxID=121627 RepID=A0A7H8R714_TALRU|nr:uncharacterized protein TRUGW13939_08914 [Talaromyces rugulosus]QKX61758.1 hypothetical protein TRUGW13939_08914 [Talaromyces rugulosus]